MVLFANRRGVSGSSSVIGWMNSKNKMFYESTRHHILLSCSSATFHVNGRRKTLEDIYAKVFSLRNYELRFLRASSRVFLSVAPYRPLTSIFLPSRSGTKEEITKANILLNSKLISHPVCSFSVFVGSVLLLCFNRRQKEDLL